MKSSHFQRLAVFWTFLLSVLIATTAQAQFQNPFKRRKGGSDRGSSELTVKDGPWMIMCTSFSGEDAEQNARLLAHELRQHRLKTYLYKMVFDYTGTKTVLGYQLPSSLKFTREGDHREDLAAAGQEPKPRKMKAANLGTMNEIAVLVGDFSSYDDHRAARTLEKVKNIQLQRQIGHLRVTKVDPAVAKARNLKVPKGGPLRTALLVPNPLLPDEYFQRQTLEPHLVKLNKKMKYSLLDCPGLYTLRIATLRGEGRFGQGQFKSSNGLEALQQDGVSLGESRLAKATENAHIITDELRSKGLEAYLFHDSDRSIVCIGSFDWVRKETRDSVINNPKIVQLANRLRPEVVSLPGAPQTIVPKSIKGIPLDVEPTPILVPRAAESSISSRFRLLR